jgi:hypothetical protein
MGLFHTFKSLQNCSDKIVKFKQDVLLSATRDRGLIGEANYLTAKGGVCASFAMAWIAQQYGGPCYYIRGQGVPSAQSEENIGITTLAVPTYVKFLKVWGSKDDKAAEKGLAKDWGLRISHSSEYIAAFGPL